ncbi:MAG TPA: D-alanyl-D-alanine carboxypeptidase family protein [Burkholderiales bacterium]|nr:D-alanyl-D-alanine carboxypeptidase family protein [Burkholderiales bacterium]
MRNRWEPEDVIYNPFRSSMMRILAALFVWFGSTLAFAQAPLNGAAALGPLASKSYLLVDVLSQQVLAAKNPDARVEPASLTKLMTAYVVFDALRQKRVTLSQPLMISEKAWRAPGSRMFLDPGKAVAIEDLLRGMIVQSGNDASIALAEGIAGTEEAFVEQMNREAARLGLKNSNFVNATGLPNPQHYSTPADLVLLSAAIIREFPQYFPMYSLHEFRYNNITQRNRNDLLGRDPYVDGLKTGYTESAGFCMIATAQRNGRRLIAVVIDAGSESGRAAEAQRLLNYGFEAFDTVKLYARGQSVHQLPVWKGNSEQLQAGFTDDYYVTIPKGFGDRLKARLESMQPLIAPIRSGDRVGTLRLTFDGQPFGERTVVALQTVGIANLFVRGWHSLRLLARRFGD